MPPDHGRRRLSASQSLNEAGVTATSAEGDAARSGVLNVEDYRQIPYRMGEVEVERVFMHGQECLL